MAFTKSITGIAGIGGGSSDKIYTEEGFIELINNDQLDSLNIGDKIQLSNPYCELFEVADKNHNGTRSSVDLIPTTQVGNIQFSSSNNTYKDSTIRTWLNDTYYNSFSSTIKSLMSTMNVQTATSLITYNSTQDKVKLLSAVEMNFTMFNGWMPGDISGYKNIEGYPYPIFTAGPYSAAIADRWRLAGNYGNSSYYWLRSQRTNDTNPVWTIKSNGVSDNYYYTNTFGVVPVIRFGGIISKSKFINLINNNQLDTLNIGDYIELSNPYCSLFQVADKNHDNTMGTVDLIPTTQVGNMIFSSSNNAYYSESPIRTWLNNTYYNSFNNDIKSLMTTMNVQTATSLSTYNSTQDKVKLLSCVEMNYSSFHQLMPGYNSSYRNIEGYPYPIFTAAPYNEHDTDAVLSRWKPAGNYGNDSFYWLRSHRGDGSPAPFATKPNGICDYYGRGNTFGVVSVIRFNNKDNYIDPTKDIFTQEEFIQLIKNKLVDKMHIGAIIRLSNRYHGEYEVIGINHDGINNSVDIMAHANGTSSLDMVFDNGSSIYSRSSIRTWLNGTYYDSFSNDIKSLMKPMSVRTATSLTTYDTTYDKVKLLSCIEMNFSTFHQYMPGYDPNYRNIEGYPYPIFTTAPWNESGTEAALTRWRAKGGYSYSNYWLRSRRTNNYNEVCNIYSNGASSTSNCYSQCGVIPVIRF